MLRPSCALAGSLLLWPARSWRDSAAGPAFTPRRELPIPTRSATPAQIPGKDLLQAGGHVALVRLNPFGPQDGVTGPCTPGESVCGNGGKNPGQGWELAVLKLAAFPWWRRRSQGGGLTQARRKPAVGSECGCAGAVSGGEAGARWPVRPAKMAAAPAAGATWGTAAAEAAAGPAGVPHGGSGGWP